jgi:hypothetical protein
MLTFLGKEEAKKRRERNWYCRVYHQHHATSPEVSGTACMVPINGRNAGPVCACGNTAGACHGRFGCSVMIADSKARFTIMNRGTDCPWRPLTTEIAR